MIQKWEIRVTSFMDGPLTKDIWNGSMGRKGGGIKHEKEENNAMHQIQSRILISLYCT